MADSNDATALVIRAFERARASGKDEWFRMTIPVLKNRILAVSEGKFKEADFHATSFRDFLRRLPADLVTLDESVPPGIAVLNEHRVHLQRSGHQLSRPRIRPDLWRAVLDYSSGRKYVWDTTAERARPAAEGDGGLVMPTVSASEFAEWRKAFSQTNGASVSPDVKSRLDRWTTENLPTEYLAPGLRALWNVEVKRRVEERLRSWFTQNEIEVPSDLLAVFRSESPSTDETEELRRYLIDCIRTMSLDELSHLQLPLRVAFRSKGSR